MEKKIKRNYKFWYSSKNQCCCISTTINSCIMVSDFNTNIIIKESENGDLLFRDKNVLITLSLSGHIRSAFMASS